MIHAESKTIVESGRPAARAAARLLATQARSMLSVAEEVLSGVGDEATAAVAKEAGEATTKLLSATFDGQHQVFACRRGS